MSGADESGAEVLARAVAAVDAGKFQEALADLERFIKASPSHATGRFNHARALMGLGRWEEAVAAFGDALRLEAGLVNAYYNRGVCRGKAGEHADAAEDFERYLERQPEEGDVWLLLGDRRLDAGDFDRAREAYERGVALDASAADRVAPFLELAKNLETLRREGPPAAFADACCERGWANFRASAWRTALHWFERALAAVPDHAEAWFGCGDCRWSLDRTEEALAALTKAAGLAPESPYIRNDLGKLKKAMGDGAGALAAFDEALRLKPDLVSTLHARGLLLGEQGNYAAAETDYAKLLEIDPKDATAWLNRGWTRRRLGRPKDAIADLTRSIEIEPRTPLAWSNRGYARREAGDQAGARADFHKVLELDRSFEAELRPLLDAPPTPPPPPPPASPPAAARPQRPLPEKLVSTSAGFRALLLAGAIILTLGLLQIPYLSAMASRAVDIAYKPFWVAVHWTDEGALPSGADLCKHPFCTAVGTESQHVIGRERYTSEVRWQTCKQHTISFLTTHSRFDGVFFVPYLILVAVLVYLIVLPAFAVAARILVLPALLPQVLAGRRAPAALLPFHEASEGLAYTVDRFVERASYGLAFLLIVAYAWW